jgi:hypothetical protein
MTITMMKPHESLHDVQNWWGAWLPWAGSSRDSVSRDSLSLSSSTNRTSTRGLSRHKRPSKTWRSIWQPTHYGSPEPYEYLQHYISTTSNVVSTAIVVYFVSKVLSDSKTRYFHIIKPFYALLIKSRKLSHYFQAHQIEVHTSSTLGEILNNREATGKIAK